MDEFTLTVYDTPLAGRMLESESARGVILFIHGLGEHIERYEELFAELASAGFHCLGTDHAGHGHSPGKRGHISSYDMFLKEVESLTGFAAVRFPELPVFLYGHSMGGNIVLRYLTDHHEGLKGAIVTSPWIKLEARVPGWKAFISQLLLKIAPSLTVSNELDPAGISTDPEEVRKYQKDPLIHDKISVALYDSVNKAATEILENGKSITTPLLLLHGTSDPITSHQGSLELSKINPSIQFTLFPGMRHELHHDLHRATVIATIKKWLESRI